MIKKLKKLTASKKILYSCWLLFILLVILEIFGLDVDVSLNIVGGIVTSVATGFYMWKSKCENRLKITLGMVNKLADKYGIENVISLLGEVFKE